MGANHSTRTVSSLEPNEKHGCSPALEEGVATVMSSPLIYPSAQGPISRDGSILIGNLENWEDEASGV